MSHSSKIDRFNRYPINLGHPLASTLWDCRTYSDERAINLLDKKSVATGLSRIAAGGYEGLDFPGSGSNFFEISSSGHFDTYTKYVIASADAISQDNLISGSTANQHALWYNGTGLQAGHNGSWTHVTGTLSTGEIHRIAVTYDGDRMAMFLDGVLIDTATGITAPTGSGASQIGAYSGVALLNGQIFFSAVWDRALPDVDVVAFDKDPSQILQIPRPTAKKYWLFPVASGASTLVAESVSYTYTPTAIELQRGLNLVAETVPYTYTPTALDLNHGRTLTTESVSYTYTPTAITLTFTPVGNFTLTAESVSYTYTATAVDLQVRRVLVAESTAYTYSVTNANLLRGLNLVTETVPYTYSVTAASLNFGRTLTTETAGYTYSVTALALLTGNVLNASTVGYTYTVTNVSITSTSDPWAVQADSSTSWSAQANVSTTWTDQSDESTTWTVQ